MTIWWHIRIFIDKDIHKSTDYSTQDVFAEAEKHYVSAKTRLMDYLRNFESPTSHTSSVFQMLKLLEELKTQNFPRSNSLYLMAIKIKGKILGICLIR